MADIQVWNEPLISEDSSCVAEVQRVFTLPFYYLPGTGELEVFYNGIKAILDHDYEEVNTNTVRFTFDCAPPDIVTFRVSRAG